MSRENVEVVQRAWEAHVRRDNKAALALYHPQIEIDLSGGQKVGTRLHYGLEGVQRYLRDWLSAFGDFRTEVEEWTDAGDQVIAIVRSYGRGKCSGVSVDMRKAHVGPCTTESCDDFRHSQPRQTPSKLPGCGSRAPRWARDGCAYRRRSSTTTAACGTAAWSRVRLRPEAAPAARRREILHEPSLKTRVLRAP
jgi:ketosteroid isomerase-like protein